MIKGQLLFYMLFFNCFFIEGRDFNNLMKVDTSEARMHLESGNTFLKSKLYENAVDEYTLAIQYNEKYSIAYRLRGRCYYKLKSYTSALADFNKSIAHGEKKDEYFSMEIVWVKVELQNYNGAIEDLNKIISKNPFYGSAYSQRAYIYHAFLGENEVAIVDYNKAIELDTTKYTPYLNRGILKYKMGDYSGALFDLNKTLSLNSNLVAAYYNRGMAKMKMNNLKDAEIDFKEGIKFASSNSYYGLGLLRSIQNQYSEAIFYFNKAIELSPDFTSVYFNRGKVKASLNDKKGAIEDMNMVISMDTVNEEAYYIRAIMKDKDIKDLTKAININSRYKEAYEARGRAYIEYPDYIPFAIDDFSTLIQLTKDSISSYYYERSSLYWVLGDTLKAIEDINKALTIDTVSYYFYSRGFYYSHEASKKYWALSDYNKALEIDKNFGDAYYLRGLLKNELKDDKGGCEDMSKANKLNVKLAQEKLKEWKLVKICR